MEVEYLSLIAAYLLKNQQHILSRLLGKIEQTTGKGLLQAENWKSLIKIYYPQIYSNLLHNII